MAYEIVYIQNFSWFIDCRIVMSHFIKCCLSLYYLNFEIIVSQHSVLCFYDIEFDQSNAFFLQTLPVCTSYLFGYQRVWRLCVSVLVCIWGSRAKPLCRRKGRTPRMQSHLYRSVAIQGQRTRSLCITFEHIIVHFMK